MSQSADLGGVNAADIWRHYKAQAGVIAPMTRSVTVHRIEGKSSAPRNQWFRLFHSTNSPGGPTLGPSRLYERFDYKHTPVGRRNYYVIGNVLGHGDLVSFGIWTTPGRDALTLAASHRCKGPTQSVDSHSLTDLD